MMPNCPIGLRAQNRLARLPAGQQHLMSTLNTCQHKVNGMCESHTAGSRNQRTAMDDCCKPVQRKKSPVWCTLQTWPNGSPVDITLNTQQSQCLKAGMLTAPCAAQQLAVQLMHHVRSPLCSWWHNAMLKHFPAQPIIPSTQPFPGTLTANPPNRAPSPADTLTKTRASAPQ